MRDLLVHKQGNVADVVYVFSLIRRGFFVCTVCGRDDRCSIYYYRGNGSTPN